MATLIEQLINKMGFQDEPNVLEKTTELVRLLELRSTNVPLQINEYGKIVLCADLAAALLGIAFDKEHALKMSGLRKSHYANNKRMFEKLLDLNKLVGVNDICIQLSINEVARKADELLELYKNVVGAENNDIDVTHPQYAAMAVFQACKLTKKKVAKTKFMPFSNLRPTQWQQLEQRWDNFVAKQYNDAMNNKLKANNIEDELQTDDVKNDKKATLNVKGKPVKIELEDYEKWKKRMLSMAESKLKQERQQHQNEKMEKENMILGM